MSGSRVSSRVLELEAKAREAIAREEAAQIDKIDATLSLVNACIEENMIPEDFSLPAEWLTERRTKRIHITLDDDSDDESVERASPIPKFRRLKQNLYKPPLQRPMVDLEGCTASCSCKYGTGCGSKCHNRLVYM